MSYTIHKYCNIYDSKIGDGCRIGSYTEIGGAEIGYNCLIQAFVYICKGTKIGNNVFIGPRVTFLNDKYPNKREGIFKPNGAVVEDNASIGAGCLILPSVKIGKGAVIGAGTVVTKDVPENTLVINKINRIEKKLKENENAKGM